MSPSTVECLAAPDRSLWSSSGVALLLSVCACGSSPTSPRQNAEPVVVVRPDGPSACTPRIGAPCALSVVADASDPDGDALTYQWSGCASAVASRATCTVQRPGTVVASVDVGDGHGHTVHAEITGTGSGENHPPGVQIGYVSGFASSSEIELLGNVMDPDEGFLCGSQYCVSASASGACGEPVVLRCTCLAGLEADVHRTAATGICSVTFTLKDSWGEIGKPVYTFDVSNIRVYSTSNRPSMALALLGNVKLNWLTQRHTGLIITPDESGAPQTTEAYRSTSPSKAVRTERQAPVSAAITEGPAQSAGS